MIFEHLPSRINGSLALNTIATLIGAQIVYSIIVAIYNLYWHPLASYPGSTLRCAFFFPDAISTLRGTRFKEIKHLHDKYGSVVRVRPDTLTYNSSQAWKDIYGLKTDRTELGKDLAFYKKGAAPQILNSNQTEHARIRKLLAPAFSDNALLKQEPLLVEYFDLFISKLHDKIETDQGRVDIMAYYNFLTFDIVSDLALGKPFGALEAGEYHTWMRNIFESIKFLGVLRFLDIYPIFYGLFIVLVPLRRSMAAKQKAHLQFTRELVDERLQRQTDRPDFVTAIQRDSKDHPRPLTRLELIGNNRVILTAGSETTATHLSGATWYLLKHPDKLRRVQAEVRSAFKNSDDITLRGVSTPGLLPYLEAVIQESLRCYPPLPTALPRVTGPEGAIIEGRFVAPNTSVGVHQWSTYRSKANFVDPDEFIPERWLPDERPAKFDSDDVQALQPFSMGPRGCLGKGLAYFEIRSTLARVLWHFDLSLEDESQDWIDQREFTVWNKHHLWVKLSLRKD